MRELAKQLGELSHIGSAKYEIGARSDYYKAHILVKLRHSLLPNKLSEAGKKAGFTLSEMPERGETFIMLPGTQSPEIVVTLPKSPGQKHEFRIICYDGSGYEFNDRKHKLLLDFFKDLGERHLRAV